MPTTAGSARLLTAEEFARLPCPADGSRQELVRGEVLTMPPPGFLHGKVQGNVYFVLESYNRAHNFGHVTVETGIVTEREPDTVRAPDVAMWSFSRVPADQFPDGYVSTPADLVVEVLSPSVSPGSLTRKIREYLVSGVRMVWLLDMQARTVTVYRRPGEGTILWDDAVLDGADVLPGFSCAVAEFFRGLGST